MEFGLTRVQVISFHRGESENHWKFHHAIQLANQLASWIASWSARPASELDSVMEFSLSRAVLLASSSLAGGRAARELVADMLATC